MQAREKVEKSQNTVFPMFCGPGRSKSRLAKAAGAEPFGRMPQADLEVKMFKRPQLWATFGSGDVGKVLGTVAGSTVWSQMSEAPQLHTTSGRWAVEKVHVVAARSTSRSQNAQNTSLSEHFWKLRCWKSARLCGAKHIRESKALKTDGIGPLLGVQMLKKLTPRLH